MNKNWSDTLKKVLGLGLGATDKSPDAMDNVEDIINTSNDFKQSKSIVANSDRVSGFPPPCTQFGQNAISIQESPPPEPELAGDGAGAMRVTSSNASKAVMFAYISDPMLVVGRYAHRLDDKRKWPYFTIIDGSGWLKYSSLSLCPSTDVDKWPVPKGALVTAGNGIIQLWNIENKTTLQFYGEHKGAKGTLVKWSSFDLNQVFAMDETGLITEWKLKENSLTKLEIPFVGITCMDVCPAEPDRIIVGNSSGSIGIISTSSGVLKLVDASTGPISNLAFKPDGIWSLPPTLKGPHFISTVNFDGKKRLKMWDSTWNLARSIYTMDSSTSSTENLQTTTTDQASNREVPIAWAKLGSDQIVSLLTVSPDGDVIKVKEDNKCETIHSVHQDHLDKVGAMIVSGPILWTFTLDSCIMGWDLQEERVAYVIPTFHGVSAMDVSKGGLSLIAFGCIDGRVRIVRTTVTPNYPEIPENYSRVPERVKQMIPTVTKSFNGKVYAVAWHPIKERLAVATDTGKLGIVTLDGAVRMFNASVRGPVYTLSWGPRCFPADREKRGEEGGETTTKLWLYVCGSKQVLMINPNAVTNGLVNVSKLIIEKTNEKCKFEPNRGATDIQWTPDFKYLAVGYGIGRVEIYSSPHLKLICFISCHSGYLQSMAFRPDDFVYKSGRLDKLCWLATGSVDGTAQLLDLRFLYDDDVLCQGLRIDIFESAQEINVHDGVRVMALAWSHHNQNLLLTCSYDQSAVIWDIEKNAPIARYTGHEHRLSKGAFHPTDEYKVITCADVVAVDCTIHIWNYLDYPYKKKEYVFAKGEKYKAVRATVSAVKKAMLPMDREGDLKPQTQAPASRAPLETVSENCAEV